MISASRVRISDREKFDYVLRRNELLRRKFPALLGEPRVEDLVAPDRGTTAALPLSPPHDVPCVSRPCIEGRSIE